MLYAAFDKVGLADSLHQLALDVTGYDVDGRYTQMVTDYPEVQTAMASLASKFMTGFTSCALQSYRDGTATTPWHDDRTMTGASCLLSVGATRTFQIRPYFDDGVEADDGGLMQFETAHDGLLWMAPDFQVRFQHRVAPDPVVMSDRFSFVFRTPI